MKDAPVLNFDNRQIRLSVMDQVSRAKGPCRFALVPVKCQRTSAQNRAFHGVVAPLIAQAMSEVYGRDIDAEGAKAFLKHRFLLRDFVDAKTGEVVGQYIPSTADLDTREMVQFIEHCLEFARDYLDLHIEIGRDEYDPPARKTEEIVAA